MRRRINNWYYKKTGNKSISFGLDLVRVYGCLLFTVLGIDACKDVDKKSHLQVFHYNEDVSVTTLDPAFVKSQSEIWIVSQIFNGLVDLNEQLQPIPALAKSWEFSNQNKTITFHLRRDAFFCFPGKEGKPAFKPLKSVDVVYSLSRIADPLLASPGAWIFAEKLDQDLTKAFVAIDDSTFQLNLLKPEASMLNLLATNYGFVLSNAQMNVDNSIIGRHPIGTGPFFLRRWEEDIKLVLRKHPNYHEFDDKKIRLPYLDAVNVSFVKNKQTAFMQFIAGSYDFFNGLEGSFKDELLTDSATLKPKYSQKLKAIIVPFLNTEYIGCYMGDFPNKTNWLKDKNLRKALEFAIDKPRLVRFFRNGLGDAGTQGFTPPILLQNTQYNRMDTAAKSTDKTLTLKTTPSQKAELFSEQEASFQRIKSAKAYFKQSGYARQPQKPILTISTTPDYLDMVVFLQEAWGRIGIKVAIDIQTGGMLRQLRNEGKIELFRGSWIADYPDAENYLACFYSPYHSPNGPNYTRYSNTDFDGLYRNIVSELGDNRADDIAKANDILLADAPVIPLYYDKSIRLFHPWVLGLSNDASNRLILKQVRIKNSLSQTR